MPNTAAQDTGTSDTADPDTTADEDIPLQACQGKTPASDNPISIYPLSGGFWSREPMQIVSIDHGGITLSRAEELITIRFAASLPQRDDLLWPLVGKTLLLSAGACPSSVYGRLEDESLNLIWEGGSTACMCGELIPPHICPEQRYFEADTSEFEEPCIRDRPGTPTECDDVWTPWRVNVRADEPLTLESGESAEVTIQGRPFLAVAHFVGYTDCPCDHDCSQPAIAVSLNPLRP